MTNEGWWQLCAAPVPLKLRGDTSGEGPRPTFEAESLSACRLAVFLCREEERAQERQGGEGDTSHMLSRVLTASALSIRAPLPSRPWRHRPPGFSGQGLLVGLGCGTSPPPSPPDMSQLPFFWKFFRACQATLSGRCQIRPAWPPLSCGLSPLLHFFLAPLALSQLIFLSRKPKRDLATASASGAAFNCARFLLFAAFPSALCFCLACMRSVHISLWSGPLLRSPRLCVLFCFSEALCCGHLGLGLGFGQGLCCHLTLLCCLVRSGSVVHPGLSS